MKSFIKRIAETQLAILLRNTLNIKQIPISLNHIRESSSVSDAFCWRTDNGFTTTFKFIDILKLYYNIDNTEAEIMFYDKDNNIIKHYIMNSLNHTNTIVIDRKFMNNTEDYGVFYIFHRNNEFNINNVIISDRSYLGFSYKNNLVSFSHGIKEAKHKNIKGGDVNSGIIRKSLLFNQKYRIQNYFKNMTKSELYFVNATDSRFNILINNNLVTLDVGCSNIVDVSNEQEINILSNSCYTRPLVFNYRGDYIDVYHS